MTRQQLERLLYSITRVYRREKPVYPQRCDAVYSLERYAQTEIVKDNWIYYVGETIQR